MKFKNDLTIPLLLTFMARGSTAVGSLFLVIIIGRFYGPSGVGILALAQSVILGAGILASYGMDSALMRFVGQDPRNPNVSTYLRWAVISVSGLSLFLSLILFLFRDIFEKKFQAEGLSSVLEGIIIAIPAFALAFLLAGYFKGVRKPVTATFLEGGSIALVAAVIITLAHSLMPEKGLVIIGWAYAVSAWLILLQGGVQVLLHNIESKKKVSSICARLTLKKFLTTSNSFFVMSLANFLHSVMSIMIAGWLLNSYQLGLFKAAQQAALMISFILIVINAIIPPRFASLYHQGKHDDLERLARWGAKVGVLLAAPFLLICLLFPRWALGLVGAEFLEAAPLLQILSIAQLINVVTGSVGFLLNMTGYEKLMRNIAWISSIAGILLLFILIPPFGAFGAAFALAVLLVMQNLAAVVFVWRKLGIWILPIPNILLFLGMKTQHEIKSMPS